MCTLSWTYHNRDHYEVYFNRDEQRTRLAAIEPQGLIIDDTNCLMPIDSVGGGSWISTNQYGVTICLLNYYQGQSPQGILTSRGLVVRALAGSDSSLAVNARLSEMDLSSCAPFTLVSFDLSGSKQANAWTWDGKELQQSVVNTPVISASKHFQAAHRYRIELYERLRQSNDKQHHGVLFHLNRDKDCPHLSPLMSRDDARTVSFTSVLVCADKQEMHYQSIDDTGCIDFEIVKKCLMINMTEQGVFK